MVVEKYKDFNVFKDSHAIKEGEKVLDNRERTTDKQGER